MKRIAASFLAATLSVSAQKIEVQTASREEVVKVQTALHHLTIIEVGEPVATVAVGSPETFRVERRENKVFIEPLEQGVATNLFIWTASTRLNYELLPAASDAGKMDIAIDYRREPAQAAIETPAAKPAEVGSGVPAEMLLRGTPVRFLGPSAAPALEIRDVYRRQDEVFIRYTLTNRSNEALRTGAPTAVSVTAPQKIQASLWPLRNSQLGSRYDAKLRSKRQPSPVEITGSEPADTEIRPGQARVGLMTVRLPNAPGERKPEQPTVLLLAFPGNGGAVPLTATLVL